MVALVPCGIPTQQEGEGEAGLSQHLGTWPLPSEVGSPGWGGAHGTKDHRLDPPSTFCGGAPTPAQMPERDLCSVKMDRSGPRHFTQQLLPATDRAAPMLAHSRSSQPASTCQRVHWLPASLRHAHLPEQEAGTERHPEDPYPRREGKRLASCMGPTSSSGTHASRQHLSQTRGRGRLQCPLPSGFAQQHARQVGHQLLSLSAAQRTGPEGRGLAQQSVHLPTGGPRRPDSGLSLGRVGFGPRKDAVPMSRRCGSRSMCSRKQRGGGARAGWAPGLWNKSLHSSSKRHGHLAPGPQTVHQVSAGPLDDEGVLGPRQGAAGSTEHLLRACGLSSRWSVKPCPALLRWLPAAARGSNSSGKWTTLAGPRLPPIGKKIHGNNRNSGGCYLPLCRRVRTGGEPRDLQTQAAER